jgi:DNA-binding response OmpR family regulator
MAEAAANNVVMVIEDTSDAQELLREALVDKGYRVLLATTVRPLLRHSTRFSQVSSLCALNLPGIASRSS